MAERTGDINWHRALENGSRHMSRTTKFTYLASAVLLVGGSAALFVSDVTENYRFTMESNNVSVVGEDCEAILDRNDDGSDFVLVLKGADGDCIFDSPVSFVWKQDRLSRVAEFVGLGAFAMGLGTVASASKDLEKDITTSQKKRRRYAKKTA